jgi:hypothetical protein
MRCIHYCILAICSLLPMAGAAHAADCGPDLKVTDDYQALSTKLRCLEDRIRTLEVGGASATSAAPAHAAPGAQEGGGVRFEAESCEKKGKAVACKMFITSLESDRKVNIYTRSEVVDRNGVQYAGLSYQGAGEAVVEKNSHLFMRRFIADVRTGCVLFFEAALDQKTDALAAMQLWIELDGKEHKITIRNIPVR